MIRLESFVEELEKIALSLDDVDAPLGVSLNPRISQAWKLKRSSWTDIGPDTPDRPFKPKIKKSGFLDNIRTINNTIYKGIEGGLSKLEGKPKIKTAEPPPPKGWTSKEWDAHLQKEGDKPLDTYVKKKASKTFPEVEAYVTGPSGAGKTTFAKKNYPADQFHILKSDAYKKVTKTPDGVKRTFDWGQAIRDAKASGKPVVVDSLDIHEPLARAAKNKILFRVSQGKSISRRKKRGFSEYDSDPKEGRLAYEHFEKNVRPAAERLGFLEKKASVVQDYGRDPRTGKIYSLTTASRPGQLFGPSVKKTEFGYEERRELAGDEREVALQALRERQKPRWSRLRRAGKGALMGAGMGAGAGALGLLAGGASRLPARQALPILGLAAGGGALIGSLKGLTKSAFKLQGHTDVQGIPVSIENRKGSVRKGKDADGKEWRTKIAAFLDELEKISGIRLATGQDLERYKIKDIDLKTSMHGTPHKIMIAEEGGKFQGLAASTDDGRVSGLYVVPRYRRRGLAKKLMNSLPTRPIQTRQKVGHKPSRAFYEREGFRGTGKFEDTAWGRMEHMERQ